MSESEPPIVPVRIPDGDDAGWGDDSPLKMKLAQFWVDHIPFGQGWFPRLVANYGNNDYKTVIRTLNRELLAVDPFALDSYCAVARTGTWEPGVLNACLTVLKADHVFLDIGANVGYMSVAIASRAREPVSVIAFEPQESLARHIAISAKLNQLSNIKVFAILLGSENRQANLYKAGHGMLASIYPTRGDNEIFTCPMRTLDRLIATRVIPIPDVMKVDVEGAELDVLVGATRLLEVNPPYIIFETNSDAGSRKQIKRRALIDFIRSRNHYQFFEVGETGIRRIGDLDSPSIRDVLAAPTCRNFLESST